MKVGLKKLTVMMVCTAMLSSVVFGFDFGHGGRPGMGEHPGIEMFQKQLHLTADQLDKIHALNLDFKKIYLKHAQVIQPIELKIQEQMLQDTLDYDQLRALFTQIAPEKIEVRLDMIRQQRAVEALLTAEQRSELKKLRMRHFHGGAEHKGPRDKE